LVDDTQTATPLRGVAESRATTPPVANRKVASPPRNVEAEEGATVGDVRVAVSPQIIGVDPVTSLMFNCADDINYMS
jgi:hypothetical protein